MFFLWKNINLIHMLDSIQNEFRFLFTTQAEPEPKLRHSGSGSLRLRLHNTAYYSTGWVNLLSLIHLCDKLL